MGPPRRTRCRVNPSRIPRDIDVVGVWHGTPYQVASVSSTTNGVIGFVLTLEPPVRASGGGAGSSPPTSAAATRLAERAPVRYITPTICPLRGARWLLAPLLTGFPTTGRANAVCCPRGAAAWTAAIRACPRRWSAVGRASGACWPIGAPGRGGGSTSRPSDPATFLGCRETLT